MAARPHLGEHHRSEYEDLLRSIELLGTDVVPRVG